MNALFETNQTFIFIDGSYFCFHRYYSLLNWWKNAYPEEPIVDPYQNEIFVEKYKKTFIENVQIIPKKLKLDKKANPVFIVGRDCKRENIWRNEFFSKYKANRDNSAENGFMGGPFFRMAYENEELFKQSGAQAVLKHPKLEADDCIAISVKYLLEKQPDCKIYIITSDRDYLQLNAENVKIYNLAFKNIAEGKTATNNAQKDLQIKIIMADNSDNIPSVFPKCGPKTALKCVEDEAYFKKKMADKPEYYNQFELNQKLIRFDKIPEDLVNEFITANLQ